MCSQRKIPPNDLVCDVVNVELSQCIIRYQARKTYGRVKV